MNIPPPILAAGRRGAAIGGLAGAGLGGVVAYRDRDPSQPRSIGKDIARTAFGAASGGLFGGALGHSIGRAHGSKIWNRGGPEGYWARNEWARAAEKPPATPDWLKGAKNKNEGRRRYHAQARKLHPDLHGGDDSHIRNLNKDWQMHEDLLKEAMYSAFADELMKIAGIGAMVGGAAGYGLAPNSIKGKIVGTAIGAGVGAVGEGAARAGKRMFWDEPRAREHQQLYGYQAQPMPQQGTNFY